MSKNIFSVNFFSYEMSHTLLFLQMIRENSLLCGGGSNNVDQVGLQLTSLSVSSAGIIGVCYRSQ